MISAVLFDFDGVLADTIDANVEFIQSLLKQNGYDEPSYNEVKSVFYMTYFDTIKHLTGEKSERRIKELMDADVDFPHHLVRPPPGEKEVLSYLNARYKLGIVSSARLGYLLPDFDRLGITKYFSTVVTEEDTKMHKPHPEPLLLAARRLNVESARCVYVGDYPSDVMAARSAGMKSILLSDENFPLADAVLDDFRDIPQAVARLAGRQAGQSYMNPATAP